MAGGYGHVADAAKRSVTEHGVPACQVAIAVDGEVQLFEAFGECSTSTRFPIYSATKPLVASAIWQLIGDGLLDVSLPVAHYVPEFEGNGKAAVTVEQVMLHVSGFPNAPMAPSVGRRPGAAGGPLRRVEVGVGARVALRVPPGNRPLGAGRAAASSRRR